MSPAVPASAQVIVADAASQAPSHGQAVVEPTLPVNMDQLRQLCASLADQVSGIGTAPTQASDSPASLPVGVESCDSIRADSRPDAARNQEIAPPSEVGSLSTAPLAIPSQQRLNVDPAQVREGLGQLVLTLVKLLHEVLERQAIRRMETGELSDSQVERLGTTLMLQAEEIRKLAGELGVAEEDLNLDLGPLGKLV